MYDYTEDLAEYCTTVLKPEASWSLALPYQDTVICTMCKVSQICVSQLLTIVKILLFQQIHDELCLGLPWLLYP